MLSLSQEPQEWQTQVPGDLSYNPIDVLEHEHVLQARLCDCLERIADGLPDHIDRALCATVALSLRVDLPTHHLDEEGGLFPLLEQRAVPDDNLETLLARLSLEHATDESFADEILEALDALTYGHRPVHPDTLGYMLRGFFETCRRHLVWENAIVLPLARKRLTPDDLKHLAAIMIEHRNHVQPRPYDHSAAPAAEQHDGDLPGSAAETHGKAPE